MRTSLPAEQRGRTRYTVARIVTAVLLTVQTLSATTYMSVEPIPNRDVVGENNLTLLRSIGYSRLERWSQRLLSECLVVDSVIDALSAHGAISLVTAANTRFVVAAGGFEGATNPSYVFTIQDSGPGPASAADVNVLGQCTGLRAESGRDRALQRRQRQGLSVHPRLRGRDVSRDLERG